jgi:phosphoribosylanthranilate isomerase
MKKILIQVYEIQTPQEAEAVIDMGVDHIGSVILSRQDWKSKEIKNTIDAIRERGAVSSLIPLFNDADTVMQTLKYYQPDIVHFCEMLVETKNKESFGYDPNFLIHLKDLQAGIRQQFPRIKIMRSIPIASSGYSEKVPSLELAEIFEPLSDLFLTDTLLLSEMNKDEQPVKGFVGITGKTCDWDMASNLVESSTLPVVLAGGISPENAYEAILKVKPAGVDSCTLTNVKNPHGVPVRFKKDPEKVEKFVMEVRKAEKTL